MTEHQQSTPEARGPVTDSPWFWLVLFVCAALVAIVVVSPKYAFRQARLERMNETREQIKRGAAGTAVAAADPDVLLTELPAAPAQRVTLGPLAVALAIVLAAGAVGVGITGYVRGAEERAANRARRRAPDSHRGMP